MGRLIVVLLASTMISGCALMTTVSGVAGAAVDGLFYMFRGAEESLSLNMRATLVATQRGLEKSGLHINVLEPVEDGYLIEVGDGSLDGYLTLERETDSLTTIKIKIKKNGMRQDSIERALVSTIVEQSKLVKESDAFDFTGYHDIHARRDTASPKVGWFLPGTPIKARKIGDRNWLGITMPSGNQAYLEGELAASADK